VIDMGDTQKEDTFRMTYTPLGDEQKHAMEFIKTQGQNMLDAWNDFVPKEERSERSRCMAIARTNLETAVMFAVKAITTKVE